MNAQIIDMSRSRSRLWPDISIRLRTNRVSSLSNRPPNRRASLLSRSRARTRDKSESDPTPAKEIAFWRFCRLTRACLCPSVKVVCLLDRASNVRLVLQLPLAACCWPTIVSTARSPHTNTCTYTDPDEHETEGACRVERITASSRGSRGHIACSPLITCCHAMQPATCNMQMQYPAKRNGPTAAGCR